MIPALRFLVLAGAAALFATACQTDQVRKDEIRDLIRHQEYAEALQRAEAAAREHPDDPKAQEDYRLASAALLLNSCRRACFDGRLEEALDFARRAREIAPESPVVQSWYEKCQRELADSALSEAIEFHASDSLEAARDCYEESLHYAPDNPRAQEGLARVLLQLNYRAGMGEIYYRDGAQALSAWFLKQARTYFTYTIKYQAKNERAADRKGEVSTMLAEDRSAIAADLEKQGQFAAAKNEYRIALLLDKELQVARDGYERTSREAAAAAAIREAEILTLKGQFDRAVDVLSKARGQSELQAEKFDEALATIEEARVEAQYQLARAMEADYRFEEAVKEYDKLLEKSEYYKDAIARRDSLESYIEQAAALYAQAMAAATPEEQIELLRRIQVFWPDYLDVRERLKAHGVTRP